MTEWIVSSAVLIVIVALVRQLLKGKISLQLQYALWAIVLVRLLVPVSFGQTKISVQNALHTQQTVRVEEQGTSDLPEAFETPEITIDIPPSRVDYVPPELAVSEPDPSLPKAEQEQQYEQNKQQWQDIMDADWEEYKAEHTRHVTLSVPDILRVLWLAGIAAVALVFLISNLRFGRRLRRSRQVLAADCPLPVYLSEAVETPCLFGLFRPAIYVTPEVAEDETALAHVLAHEETHCRHWDHVWALLRCVCLVVHWYNPLVWLAASLSRRDAELACDEGAIRRIGEGERSAYGRTLIGLTCARRSNLLHTATTMTGSKKSIKERIVLIAKKPKMAVYTLIAVILIAAIAVACTFTGAERIPLVKQLQQVKPETVKLIASQNDTELYWLSEDEYEEMLEMLHGITEEQCLEEVEYPGDFSYGLQVRADEGGWYFRIVTHEEYGEGVIGLYDDYDEDYTKAYWLWIDSPELRQYMIDVFNREKAEISEPPAFVQVAAETYVEQRRAEVEQKFIAISVTHEVLSELKGLSELELGTAGLDWAVKMWQLDYDITVAFGRRQEGNTTPHTAYLVFLYDYASEQYTRFLGSVDDETLLNVYNIPEMVSKYGDMYRAAAMEIYSQYVEASKQLNAPVSPSDGLYNLTKRGDTVSLTLHTKEEGEQRTFVLDYQSDAWKTSNRLTGVSWNLLSEAPEGTWDYWLTYTSEDGTVSITFYAGKNGPVCYTDEQRTVWWTERGGTPDAETLRREVYDVCLSAQEPEVSVADLSQIVNRILVGGLMYDDSWQSMGSFTLTSTAADGRVDTYVSEPRHFSSLASTPGGYMAAEYEWTEIDASQWIGLAENEYSLTFANDRYSVTVYSNENKLELQTNGETRYFVGNPKYESHSDFSDLFYLFRQYAEDALWDYEMAACQVSGSETDYDLIARELAEQYAQIILKRPGWASQQALDVKVDSTEVTDAYYGADNPNFCFVGSLYLKVTDEQRDFWEIGSGLAEPPTSGPYAGYFGYGLGADVKKCEDGNWHMTGMWTGGESVALPVSLDDATVQQLMELYFLTEGKTHDWRIVYRLAGKPLEEVAAQLKQLETAQRRELTNAIATLIEEYPEYAAWTAEDFLAASDGGT